MTSYPASLEIHRLRLMVRLGEHEEERSAPQPVELDVRFFFSALPAACGDDHETFLCYDKLGSSLTDAVEAREFRLIEFMTYEIYTFVRAYLKKTIPRIEPTLRIWVRLYKCSPPVSFPLERTSFTYTDLPEGVGGGGGVKHADS